MPFRSRKTQPNEYPSLHDPHWDPFWQACSDENTIVNLHIGSSSSVVITSVDAPVDTMITLQPMSIVQAAADLVWSPMLRRFPDLRSRCRKAESAGYLTSWSGSTVSTRRTARGRTRTSATRLPSQVFLERVALCFIDDEFGVANRDKLNMDMVTWECDYPHSDSTWPLAPETLDIYLDGVPDDETNKITHENALRLYNFDMFKHIPKEELTVGALRRRRPPTSTSASGPQSG